MARFDFSPLTPRSICALACGLAATLAFVFLPARASEPPPTERLIVTVTGLRNTRGNIVVSLFRGSDGFPDDGEKALASRVVSAQTATTEATDIVLRIPFDGLTSGDYAVALFHDENGNGKLDTHWGIPTEGFGFSNHPKLRWRAPKYKEAQFTLAAGAGPEITLTVPLRYLR